MAVNIILAGLTAHFAFDFPRLIPLNEVQLTQTFAYKYSEFLHLTKDST